MHVILFGTKTLRKMQVITCGIFSCLFLCRRCQWKRGSRMTTNLWLPTVWQVSILWNFFVCISIFVSLRKIRVSKRSTWESLQQLFPNPQVLLNENASCEYVFANVLPSSATVKCVITANMREWGCMIIHCQRLVSSHPKITLTY